MGRLGVAIPGSGGSELGAAQHPPESLDFIDAVAPKKGQVLISDARWVPSPSWRCREPEASGTLWSLRNLLERYRGQLSGVKRRREAEDRSGSARGLARSSG